MINRVILLLLAGAPLACAEKLTVEMTEPDNPNANGVVLVALFRTAEGFPLGAAYRNATVELKQGKAVAVFDQLEPGSYAVVAYHDKNKNSKLDRNLVTKPTEPYGFANNARGVFGPPPFEKTLIQLPAGGKSIAFDLK